MAEPIQIQQLGGTTEQLAGFTGKDKVIVINVDTHRPHFQDGKTPGGLPGALLKDVTDVQKETDANAAAITALQQKTDAMQTTLDGKPNIDDSAKAADKVYSSQKTEDLVTQAKQQVKNDLLNGVGAEMDTLKEVADAIKTNKDALTALQTVAGKHVSYEAQTLTSEQKTQARTNIDAVSSAQLATKLNGTVAKVGEVPEGGKDSGPVNIDTLNEEGEYYLAKASGRPSGVTDAYQGLHVEVRVAGTAISQTVRGAEDGRGRVFLRTGTAGGDGAVTWGTWVEVGSKQDLSGYATKAELKTTDTKAQKGVDEAKKANDAIAALGALAHKSQISPADLTADFDLGSIA